MAVDFAYAPDRRYQDYLGSHNVRANIEVVLSKPIRQSIGSLEDIFKHNTDALADALKDLAWFPSGPNENVEVARINLWDICGTLDAGQAGSVTAFQSLFVKTDERKSWHPALTGPAKSADASSADLYAEAVGLAREEHYADALAVLTRVDPTSVTDWRYDQLRGTLLLGIAGRGKSAVAVDLRAAEEAFLTASARAREQDLSVSAYALACAGKAAYASGRLEEATVHFQAAINLDARCGEAHYQLARICMQARDVQGARRHLPNAFDCHWSYGMRAASDPVLAAKPALAVSCLQAATRAVAGDARTTFAEAASRFKFLTAQQDRLLPLSECPGFTALSTNMAANDGAFQTRLLKRAFDMRKHATAMYDGVYRTAADYVTRLRGVEAAIIHRDERVRMRRDPAEAVRPWVRGVEFSLYGVIALLLCIKLQLMMGPPDPWWRVLFLPALLLTGIVLFRRLPIASQLFDERLGSALAAFVTAWQRFAVRREMRRNIRRARRNEARLNYRVRRIERRFGLPPSTGRTTSAPQPEVLDAQWVRGSMVPAE